MKKILITLFLLYATLPSIAANWQEYTYKGWYDLGAWVKNGNYVTVWFKDLNPGDWDLINNKKVWYRISQIQADCAARKIKILNATEYDLKGNTLNNYTNTDRKYYEYGRYYVEDNWMDVVPDSIGETKYYLMCTMR